MSTLNLNLYTVFYPKKGQNLGEQLAGKTLAGQEVKDFILRSAEGLSESERLKMFPEDWRMFVDNRKPYFYFLTEVKPKPKPTYCHSVPKDMPAVSVAGISCTTKDDSFSGEGYAYVLVCPTELEVRTDKEYILDTTVGYLDYNGWSPSDGILVMRQ